MPLARRQGTDRLTDNRLNRLGNSAILVFIHGNLRLSSFNFDLRILHSPDRTGAAGIEDQAGLCVCGGPRARGGGAGRRLARRLVVAVYEGTVDVRAPGL
jgi:hypothetical protein